MTPWIVSVQIFNPSVTNRGKWIVSFSRRMLCNGPLNVHWGQWWSLLPTDGEIFLCTKSFPEHFLFGQCTLSVRLIMLLSYWQSRLIVLHIVIALTYITLVCNLFLVLVQVLVFPIVKVEDFFNFELITVRLKLLGWKRRKICCFEIGTVNEIVSFVFQWYFNSNVQMILF